MALLTLQNAHFDYGREKIMRGVNLALQPGIKYALVGPNGAGKTTLLSVLGGELELQDGTRQIGGRITVRQLRQETTLVAGEGGGTGLREIVASGAFAYERGLEHRLAMIATEIVGADSVDHGQLVAEQGKIQAEFERVDGYTMDARLETALRGVGLRPAVWDTPVTQLSGGERRRAALAQVLLSQADLLLLDEPTNHLDLESCEWLEGFLRRYPGAALTVSHDRYFLDRVATTTLHLDCGRLISYAGNYSFYDKQSALRYRQDLAAWERQQSRIKQTEDFIRRNIEGQKTKQAQSRRKQLDREDVLERPTAEAGLFHFELTPQRPSGGSVVETHALGKGYGGRLLVQDFEINISRGDRVGIIGPNGCGKSTLLKMIAGVVLPDTGRVVVGHNVDLGYYDQELSGVSDYNTVLAEMMAVSPRATLGELRSFLAAFGFGADLYDRPVSALSGGERGRLALLRLIKEGHNTLLLDEPTNHLDIRSRESLEAALSQYTGTMVVVSHDRRFLDKLVNRLVVFPHMGEAEGLLRVFDGSYGEYVWQRTQAAEAVAPVRPVARVVSKRAEVGPVIPALSKNEAKRRQQWITEAEDAIVLLEAEQEMMVHGLSAPGITNTERLALSQRCLQIETELAGHLAHWEQWSLEIEAGEDRN